MKTKRSQLRYRLKSIVACFLLSTLFCCNALASTTGDLYDFYKIEKPESKDTAKSRLESAIDLENLERLNRDGIALFSQLAELQIPELRKKILDYSASLDRILRDMGQIEEFLLRSSTEENPDTLFLRIDEWRDLSSRYKVLGDSLAKAEASLQDLSESLSLILYSVGDSSEEKIGRLKESLWDSVDFSEIGELDSVPYPLLTYPNLIEGKYRSPKNTPIVSLFDGRVLEYSKETNSLKIDHGSKVYSVYYNVGLALVEELEYVYQGQKLALSGSLPNVEVKLFINEQEVSIEELKLKSIYAELQPAG